MTKKRLSAIAIIAAIAMSGCAKGDNGGQTTAAQQAQESQTAAQGGGSASEGARTTELNLDKEIDLTVMLTPYWKGVLDPHAEGADYPDYFEYVGELFHEKYPNVNVEVKIITGSERAAIINTALQSGTQPDISFETVMALTDYAHQGALVPLDDLIEDEDRADIAEPVWDLGKVGGQQFFYPFAQSVGLYQANADILRRAGLEDMIPEEGTLGHWTPEEYEKVLRTLKEEITDEGFYPMGFYCANDQSDQFSNTLLKMFGGRIFNEDSSACVANDPKTVKAMETILGWYQDGLIQPSPESATFVTTREMFRNQKLAIVSTSSANALADRYDMENGDIPEFEVCYFTMPGEEQPVSLSMLYGACVYDQTDPDRVAFAKEFVKFFSTDPELVKASAIVALPVRESVMKEVKGENIYADAMTQAIPYVLDFTGSIPSYVEFRSLLYPTFQAVFTGAKSPQDALDDLAADASELIEIGREDSVLFN